MRDFYKEAEEQINNLKESQKGVGKQMKEGISIREYFNLINEQDTLFYELRYLIKNSNNTQGFDEKQYSTITAVESAIYDLLQNMEEPERNKLMESKVKDIAIELGVSEYDVHVAHKEIATLEYQISILERKISLIQNTLFKKGDKHEYEILYQEAIDTINTPYE